ncbi:MAG: EscU/YscU/HrcU family type III secretion system export apparatus switch protein [Bryobacteraceae bacterium]|nr:EscU/YscU/HrcU family type III secretion system export apparatus switch protein [Bryobacteraceae bacterium]
MADSSQQTEKATPRRIEKAREQGRFPVSREAFSAATFAVAASIVLGYAPDWLEATSRLFRHLLRQAFSSDLTLTGAIRLWRLIGEESLMPLVGAGTLTLTVGLAVQLGMTGFGIAGSKIAPDIERLNSLSRLKEMPSQNAVSALQSLALLAVFAGVLWMEMGEWIPAMLRLPLQSLPTAFAVVGETLGDLLRKATLIFAVLGAIDLFRQRNRYFKGLRMSKQEIRDESKESEGNPMLKQRIRKLQRDAARRRMMDKVPQATAVVVNPTHYAVAIQFDMNSMAAPRVVAKGKNYLARRIREIAIANQIPIVENPPLAQSLYKHVEVGREIPANLYRAVAEVLAYIFRLMNARAPRGRRG